MYVACPKAANRYIISQTSSRQARTHMALDSDFRYQCCRHAYILPVWQTRNSVIRSDWVQILLGKPFRLSITLYLDLQSLFPTSYITTFENTDTNFFDIKYACLSYWSRRLSSTYLLLFLSCSSLSSRIPIYWTARQSDRLWHSRCRFLHLSRNARASVLFYWSTV